MSDAQKLRTLTDRARQRLEEHRDFVLLALLFTSFRLMALLLFEPGGYILDWSGYYIPGASFVELADKGLYPVVHYWMEYPPLFPWLAVLAYRLSMFIPSWTDPALWYSLSMGSLLLAFETGNFVLIYAIALKVNGRETAVRCAWLYAGLFFPLMTVLFWFENLPLFFLLLGVYMIVTKRPVWAGVAAGLGFMVKLLPAFVIPAGLRVFPKRREKITYALAAVLVALVVALPFLASNPSFFLVPFLQLGSRAPWETIWALLDRNFAGGYIAPLETRFDLATVTTSVQQPSFPYPVVVLAFVVIFLVLYTRRIDWQDNLKAVAFCGLSMDLVLLFSKGYSPQWIINVLPFVVLLMPNLKGVAYSLLLMAANVLEFPISLMVIAGHPWAFATAVILRTLLLVLLAVDFGLILFPSAKGRRVAHVALISLVLLTVLGALPVGALALRDYTADRYAGNAYAETISYLKAQPKGAVIFSDSMLYHQVFPFLVWSGGLYLLEDDQPLDVTLGTVTAPHDTIYVVYTDSEDDQRSNPAVEGWLRQWSFPVSVQWLSNARVTRYSVAAQAPHMQPLRADFAQGIQLVGSAFDQIPLTEGDVVHVSLQWRSLEGTSTDYTVFLHLIDSDDRIRAQRDSQPVGGSRPTSSWQPGEEIADNHGLALPLDLPPGEYRIRAGLYDPMTGERFFVLDDQGDEVEDSVVVGTVVVTGTRQ